MSFSSAGLISADRFQALRITNKPVAAESGMSQITRASYRLFKELRPPHMNAFSTMPANRMQAATRHLFSGSVNLSEGMLFGRNLPLRSAAVTTKPSMVVK
jgi:hypothetical protein